MLIGLVGGLGLSIVGIGLLIIVVVLALVGGVADFERTLIRVLLGVENPAPTRKNQRGLLTQTKHLVTDLRTWKAVVYLLSVFIYGTIVFGPLALPAATVRSSLFAPLYYREAPVVAYGPVPQRVTFDIFFRWDTLLVGLTTTFRLGSWQIETLPGAVFVAGLGFVPLLMTFQFVNASALLWKRYTRVMFTVPQYWRLP